MKKNRTLGIIVIFVIAVIILAAVALSHKGETGGIKIGVIQPLTGEASAFGVNAKKGVELAVKEINEQQKIKITLIVEDSKTSSLEAVNAFNKLVNVDQVKFVIGDIVSTNLLAIKPIAERSKVLIVAPGASNPEISKVGGYIFRTWPSDSLQGQLAAEFVSNHFPGKKIAVLYVNNDYGSGLVKVFKLNLKKVNGDIVIEETYELKDKNYKPVISKIMGTSPDILYLVTYPDQLISMLLQLKTLKFTGQIIGTESFEGVPFEKIKTIGDGCIYSYAKSPEETEIVKHFRSAYKEFFKEDFGAPADYAYDALNLMVEGIQKKGYRPDAVKDYLYSVKDYQGASGIISFDKNGDVIKPYVFKKITGGKIQVVE